MKMRTVLLVLLVVAVLTTSGSIAADARASTAVSNVLSGGRYMLTFQSTGVSPAGGYRLSAGTVVDPAPGCCCKANLPCVQK
jgi:hypothetical protein